MKNLLEEIVPAWFELSLTNPTTPVVRVHEQAFEHLKSINWVNAPIVKHVMKGVSFKKFDHPQENGYFGFGEVLRIKRSTDIRYSHWMEIECALPKLYDGTWIDDNRSKVWEIRHSLALLFFGLRLFEGDTGWKDPQLMGNLDLCVEASAHGGSMTVFLTVPTCVWLSKRSNNSQIVPVVEAMRSASKYMWEGVTRTDRFGARCRQPKWINLDVPGDACGLDPETYGNESLDRGYSLAPHNIDSSLQQLTFLAGLAKLHDEIRKG